MGAVGTGWAHLREEWGRWWRTEDLTDTHIAHRVLNDQFRLWQRVHTRTRSEVQQNITLLKQQQKQSTYLQMQRMQMQKRARGHGGGYGGFGYGGFGGGASPMITYRTMQWAQLQIKLGQEEFQHTEVTPGMLAVGRGQVQARRHRAAVVWLLGIAVAWGLVWWASALAALTIAAVVVLAVLAAAWGKGRQARPAYRRPPVPRLLFVPPKAPAATELAIEEEKPFALREAGKDPRQARKAVQLALQKHRVEVEEVRIPQQTSWGWEVPITLSGGTLGDVIRVLPRLSTPLKVGPNRLLARSADPEDSSAITLKVLLSDPFADPLPVPPRAPRSCSITSSLSLGLSLEGETTPVILRGQHVFIVASSGGGKSSLVRTLADYVTACSDAVAVDIDPTGRGLGPYGPAATRRALTPQDAEVLLEELHQRAVDRIRTMPPEVDNWVPTAEQPSIHAFVDEWPHLTSRGKELGIALSKIGRKAAITLVLCSTDATADAVGDAIADTFGVRILLPCRLADVPLVVGQSDAVARGWLPHLLVPSPGEWDPADAGRFYCVTPRHREPVLRYASPISTEVAAARAAERAAVGVLRLEEASHPGARDVPEIAGLILRAFAAEGDPEILTVAQLADHLGRFEPEVWTRWDKRKDRLTMVGRTLREHLKRAGLQLSTVRTTLPGRPAGIRLTDVREALE